MTSKFLRASGALILSATLGAIAADYYVSPTGNDANTGTAAAPLRTVQAGVKKAVAGDTVRVKPGTYRESVTLSTSGTSTKPITIIGDGGRPVISGSQVVTGWVRHSGNIWKKTGFSTKSQQVFVNSVRLKQIGKLPSHYDGVAADGSWMIKAVGSGVSDMTAGSFHHDGSSTLYVHLADSSDPNSATVEACVQRQVLNALNVSWIRLENLSFRHNNSSLHQQQQAGVDLGNDCVMKSCDVRFMDYAGVAFGWQKARAQMIDCESSDNGDMGVTAGRHSAFLVRNCRFYRNNTRGFNPQWAAGGLKATADAYGTIEDSEAKDNRGPGFWFDYCDSGNPIVIRNNKAIGNYDKAGGIILEGSKNGMVCGNLVAKNDRRGIYISASDDVKVWANTLVGNIGHATLDVSGMPRSGKTLKNIEVMNNLFANNTAGMDLMILKENGSDIVNIRANNNLYQNSNGLKLRVSADSRGDWAGTTYTSLSAWKAGTIFDDNGVQGDPRFVDAAGGDYRLGSGSPAIDAGRALTGLTTGLGGATRPLGGVLDIGCYEAGAAASVTPTTTTATAPATTTSTFSAKVNFQPASSATVSGWTVDSGAAYGTRNGKTYGWNRAITGNTVDRNGSTDQLKDTFIGSQAGGNATWEMAVPNGTYKVRVMCGDPSYWSETVYHVMVEGKVAVDAAQTSATRWREATVTVTVSDGKLTVTNGSKAWNNQLNLLEITKQ